MDVQQRAGAGARTMSTVKEKKSLRLSLYLCLSLSLLLSLSMTRTAPCSVRRGRPIASPPAGRSQSPVARRPLGAAVTLQFPCAHAYPTLTSPGRSRNTLGRRVAGVAVLLQASAPSGTPA